MVSRVSHTTIDCSNAFPLSEWWKAALQYTDIADDPDEFCVLRSDRERAQPEPAPAA